jgi:chemotaxis protein MotB
MALARNRRYEPVNYWPGFVDALSTMLLIIIFLLSVFMLSQYFLTREVTGKDSALELLNRQIEELTTLLAMERSQSGADADKITRLNATLDQAKKDKQDLEVAAASGGAGAAAAGNRAETAVAALDAQKTITQRALAQVEVLNQQIAALRKQLAAIQDALSIAKTSERESQEKISDLGKQLNIALAQKVQELARYRSDFFGRLRQILGSRPDIAVVGDRFVFQSSVLFDAGKADVSDAGKKSLDRLAEAALDLEREIPPDIPWILRIDGHTDARPIQGGAFKSNWELSAARAIAVAQYLISKGVDPHYLAAAGFGEFQPLEAGTSEEAYQKNRRIELKLTER